MHNLDQLAAQIAQKIVNNASPKELENLATKALGVLQENGVYAAALFLQSRTRKVEQELAQQIRENLYAMLGKVLPSLQIKSLKDVAEKISNDLDTLLLVKQLWEQTLIYARYGAKAAQQESKNKKQASAGDEAKGGAS